MAEDPRHWEELFADVAPVRARRMFGGLGLSLDGLSVGLVVDGTLFLKVDDVTRASFEAAGGRPFVYEAKGKRSVMSYWTPPATIFDDTDDLRRWLALAHEAARRQAKPKTPKAAKAAVRRPAPAGRARS